MRFRDFLNHTITKAVGIVTLVFSLIGGVWMFDDRYCSAGELEAAETRIVQSMEQLEKKSELRHYEFLHDQLTYQYFQYKRLVRENPNDQELKEELEIIKKRKEEAKENRDTILNDINGKGDNG